MMTTEATIEVTALEFEAAKRKAYALAHLASIQARPLHSGVYAVDGKWWNALCDFVQCDLVRFRRTMGWRVEVKDPKEDRRDRTKELRLITSTDARLVFVPVKLKKSDRG